MGVIQIEFDNTLKKSEIITPLLSSSKAEYNDNYNSSYTDKAQTSVLGIKMPLIMINSTVIDIDSVKYFNLKSEGILPELILTVEDRYELINNVDKPSHDNEVRIQILPRFDNTYKKIDLTFYIASINVTGSLIKMVCTYKSPKLLSAQFKTFGEIDSYTFFKDNAIATELGFATNVAGTNDKRYIYCDNKSLYEIMNTEIQHSNSTDHILDWWIDLWDNINLVDIKERYNAIDSDDELSIWVAPQVNDISIDTDYKPILTTAFINNMPTNNASELFYETYSIVNKSGANVSRGSDKIYSIYEDANEEYSDFLVQDGDVHSDIFTKYEYIGEAIGDYNYLLSKCLRSAYLQKINSEQVKVTMKNPLIALMRGHKVNMLRYINNDMIENKLRSLEDFNAIDRNIQSNIPLNDYEITSDSTSGKYVLDKTVSGQYLITGVNIVYSNFNWEYILTLIRPSDSKQNIINS
jgi:hypothetical protein